MLGEIHFEIIYTRKAEIDAAKKSKVDRLAKKTITGAKVTSSANVSTTQVATVGKDAASVSAGTRINEAEIEKIKKMVILILME